MSFVSTKQQKLIELSISNYIRFYDKFTGQYLQLRQEIYQLHTAITSEGPSDELGVRALKLKFQLDTLVEGYTLHLKQFIDLLETSKITQPYQKQIEHQLAEMKDKQERIASEIHNIKTVQKPLLDKMIRLLKRYHNTLDNKSHHHRNVRKIQPRDLDYQLIFTEAQITAMFSHLPLADYLDNIVNNGKLFEKLDDGRYFYNLKRSSLHDVDSTTTSGDYDKLIATSLAEIDGLLTEGEHIKNKWNLGAAKIMAIKQTVDQFGQEEA